MLLATGAAIALWRLQPAAAQVSFSDARAKISQRDAAQRKLTAALTRIAADSRNGFALLDAGEAALALGDADAAAGFLYRAGAALPREARVKSALGGDDDGAGADPPTRCAISAKAPHWAGSSALIWASARWRSISSGDPQSAQRDYRGALQLAPNDPEIVRNYAISLGVAGSPDAGVALLDPQLRAQDRAAWRARAFILAMNGRQEEAYKVADAVMPPNLANAIKPYFAGMSALSADAKGRSGASWQVPGRHGGGAGIGASGGGPNRSARHARAAVEVASRSRQQPSRTPACIDSARSSSRVEFAVDHAAGDDAGTDTDDHACSCGNAASAAGPGPRSGCAAVAATREGDRRIRACAWRYRGHRNSRADTRADTRSDSGPSRVRRSARRADRDPGIKALGLHYPSSLVVGFADRLGCARADCRPHAFPDRPRRRDAAARH